MSTTIKDRHLFGAGAAACAICCAPPILALLGIAGAGLAATIATIAFAGVAFGTVVLAASLLAIRGRRRNRRTTAPCSDDGRVEVAISASPPDATHGSGAGR